MSSSPQAEDAVVFWKSRSPPNLTCLECYFARVAILRIGGFCTETYFLTVLGAESLRSRCRQGWCLLDADDHLLPVPSDGLPSLCVCVVISSSENTGHIGSGPTGPRSTFVTTLKALSPSTVTF